MQRGNSRSRKQLSEDSQLPCFRSDDERGCCLLWQLSYQRSLFCNSPWSKIYTLVLQLLYSKRLLVVWQLPVLIDCCLLTLLVLANCCTCCDYLSPLDESDKDCSGVSDPKIRGFIILFFMTVTGQAAMTMSNDSIAVFWTSSASDHSVVLTFVVTSQSFFCKVSTFLFYLILLLAWFSDFFLLTLTFLALFTLPKLIIRPFSKLLPIYPLFQTFPLEFQTNIIELSSFCFHPNILYVLRIPYEN